MKCSICKNVCAHLTKVEKKLFCDQCKLNPIELKIEATPLKQEIDFDSDDTSDSTSSRNSLQNKLKSEIDLQEDDETVDSENHSLDASYYSKEIDGSAGTTNSSWSIPSATVAKAMAANEKLKCDLCDYRCMTLNTMRKHRKKFHPELATKSIRCKICFRALKGMLNLNKHIDEEHDGFGAKCKFCLEKVKRGQQPKHQRLCEGRHLFSCGTCGKSYVKLESVRNHLDEHGVTEIQKDLSVVRTRTRERLFVCVICEEGLVYEEEAYWKHVKEQHDGHYLRCDDCGKTHKDSGSAYNHKIIYCKVLPARERFITKVTLCPHCSKSCKNKSALEVHIYKNHRRAHTCTLFSCKECGLKFQTYRAYYCHKVKTHLEPKFKCTECPKTFNIKFAFNRHLQTHGRGPIQCKVCDITFKHHLVLANHIKTKHRPKETFECKQCSKRYSTRNHYTIHMRKIHGHDRKKVSS